MKFRRSRVSCMVGPPVETPHLEGRFPSERTLGWLKSFMMIPSVRIGETSLCPVIPEKVSSGDINFITGTMITSSGSGKAQNIKPLDYMLPDASSSECFLQCNWVNDVTCAALLSDHLPLFLKESSTAWVGKLFCKDKIVNILAF